MVSYAEPGVVNHGLLYDGPVSANHGVLCGVSGFKSWCGMISQWL
jgi:hypothetical protein